jgi:hypothetical protein
VNIYSYIYLSFFLSAFLGALFSETVLPHIGYIFFFNLMFLLTAISMLILVNWFQEDKFMTKPTGALLEKI